VRKLKVIVQKLGGSSLSSPAIRKAAVRNALQARQRGYQVVVVVSAMGRVGDPYSTDTLLGLAGSLSAEETDLLLQPLRFEPVS
jgi:aspartate kinase